MNIAETLTNRGLGKAILLIALAAGPSSGAAQSIAVGGPSLAYVFDAGRLSIRPLIGVAGSSFLGDATLTGLQFASVAPNGTSAIAIWSDRVEWIADLGDYPGSSAVIEGSLANPDRIFWDRASSSAVLFSSTARQAQFVQRAGGAFTLRNASTPDSCVGAVKALAADAANSIAAVLCSPSADTGATPSLFFLQPDSISSPVQTPDIPVSAAFAQDGSLYIAGGTSTVSVVRNPGAGAGADLLFVEPDAPNGASALLVQSAEQLLYSADGAQRRVRVYNLNSFEKIDDLAVDWQPTQFQPFLPNSFLLNTGAKSFEPVILLRTAPKRAVLFVPAGE